MSYGIRKFWCWTFTQHTSFYLTSYVGLTIPKYRSYDIAYHYIIVPNKQHNLCCRPNKLVCKTSSKSSWHSVKSKWYHVVTWCKCLIIPLDKKKALTFIPLFIHISIFFNHTEGIHHILCHSHGNVLQSRVSKVQMSWHEYRIFKSLTCQRIDSAKKMKWMYQPSTIWSLRLSPTQGHNLAIHVLRAWMGKTVLLNANFLLCVTPVLVSYEWS